MRTLFSATPAFGHVLPLLPLAHAARDSGSEVAVLTAAAFGDVVAPLPVVPAGPDFADLDAEFRRRTGATDVVALDAAAFGELFGAVRIDLTVDQAVQAALRFDAELIVAEREDTVGPLVAATLGIPWVRHLLGADLPQEIGDAIANRAEARYVSRALTPVAPVAVVDPWPDFLQPAAWTPAAGRVVIRPQPHGGAAGGAAPWAHTSGRRRRPRVLVTPGTITQDVDAVAALIASLAAVDVDVVLTGRHGAPWPIEADPAQVHQVGFLPLEHLLTGADLVVLAGGSGTLVAALSRGLPLVLSPMVFDQYANAERAAATGAAVIATDPADVGSKVRQVLEDPGYRIRARNRPRRSDDRHGFPKRGLDPGTGTCPRATSGSNRCWMLAPEATTWPRLLEGSARPNASACQRCSDTAGPTLRARSLLNKGSVGRGASWR